MPVGVTPSNSHALPRGIRFSLSERLIFHHFIRKIPALLKGKADTGCYTLHAMGSQAETGSG